MGKIGFIGGSGLYKIEGLTGVKEVEVKTPFGEPSDKFITGKLEGKEIVFLPRHGIGHRILPSEINYRANIYGMKKLAVDKIISVAACGSLKDELKPMDFVLPDQFVDRTNQARKMTFFGNGIVAHIGFAHPVCGDLCDVIYRAGKSLNLPIHKGGAYLNMEGPAFSTLAESNLYRSWGMDIVAMTNMSEAKLAREAEICYATLAAVTDYDCWHPDHASVTIEMIIQNLQNNIENARKMIRAIVKSMPEKSACACGEALKFAIMTDKEVIPAKTRKDLDIIIGKYIK